MEDIYDPNELHRKTKGRDTFTQFKSFHLYETDMAAPSCDTEEDLKNNYRLYFEHVKTRAFWFIRCLYVVMNVIKYLDLDSPYTCLMSDTAQIQSGEGVRVQTNATGMKLSLDAAHYVNTSILDCNIAGKYYQKYGKHLSSEFQSLVTQFSMMSGNTSSQAQAANVGPDKVIDTQQTQLKNAILSTFNKSQPLPDVNTTRTIYQKQVSNQLEIKAIQKKYSVLCSKQGLPKKVTSCCFYKTAIVATNSVLEDWAFLENIQKMIVDDAKEIYGTQK